jgi:hypothetical protein
MCVRKGGREREGEREREREERERERERERENLGRWDLPASFAKMQRILRISYDISPRPLTLCLDCQHTWHKPLERIRE